jgi:hypothetical protein
VPRNQILLSASSLPMRATYPFHIILDLITLTIFGEEQCHEAHHYSIFSLIHLPPF